METKRLDRKNSYVKLIWGVLLLFPLLLNSCKKESNDRLFIESVWSNMTGVESQQINSCFTGQWVRLEGSGFDELVAIYCNGYRADFSPILNTNSYITFQVPSGTPIAQEVADESVKNTIRVVTTGGEFTYQGFVFKDRNRMPGISSVSYTLPQAGDKIYIEGLYLSGTSEIYFPAPTGEVEAMQFTVISDRKIEVTVPAGVGEVSGAIRIVSMDDSYYSPSYMFYKQGIFLDEFIGEIMVPGTYSNTRIYTDAAEIAALTGLTNNPASIMAIPERAKDIAVASGKGVSSNFFKYYGVKGFERVIANLNGEISENSSIENLAIQFDLFMPTPWISGGIAFKMNKDRNDAGSHVCHLTPWSASAPFTFDHGWRTITVNFSDFPGLALGTLGTYMNNSRNFESLFGFVNFDLNNDGHTPRELTNFQLFIANFRLVPTTTPID